MVDHKKDKPRIVYCDCCGRQVIQHLTDRNDPHCTTSQGAVASFPPNVICGYCAEELDENGLFPEERATLM